MADHIEMAKAYVQIVPSAQGIKGALEDVFGKETDGLGAKTGLSIGTQLVGTIKKVVAAAGIGKLIKDSLDMGGALQQSIGGIETLFKDSADTVKQYAAQAYQTVGLSANDYMEQTTSFAASLLSSVSKDTNAAAQLANMAMVDMADGHGYAGYPECLSGLCQAELHHAGQPQAGLWRHAGRDAASADRCGADLRRPL